MLPDGGDCISDKFDEEEDILTPAVVVVQDKRLSSALQRRNTKNLAETAVDLKRLIRVRIDAR